MFLKWCLVCTFFLLSPYSPSLKFNSAFGFFGKKTKERPMVEEKLSDDDKIGFVNRNEKDLTQLKSFNFIVPDAIDANCAFKIKSVLQDNDAIYKVTHSDFKNYTAYFENGHRPDKNLIITIVTAAGYKIEFQP